MINHIAFIMDGNRRWALSKGLLKVLGHKEGLNKVKEVVNYCLQKGVKYISLYVFSTENLKRAEEEKKYLFNMFESQADKFTNELVSKGVRVRFVGDRSIYPEQLLYVSERMEKATESFDSLHMNFMFCYGGQQEIVAGVKSIIEKVKLGQLKESDIDEQIFYKNLWSGEFPEPDAIVRTGNQVRLSNFMLYQAAYSELFFLDCMWPDINNEILDQIFQEFENRKRNFGK